VALALGAFGVTGLIAGAALLALLLLPAQVDGDALPGAGVGMELSADPMGEGSQAGVPVGRVESERTLVVDVAGAVMRPGLVRLRGQARVGDAIAAAGGFSPRVDLAETSRTLNLAETLADGAKVVVSELGTQPSVGTAAVDGLIDLNSADQAALEGLPGIGPVTAAKIIEAREQQRFGSIEELRSREIVGESVFEDIQGLVRASG
jgi:competence protein ComEA